MKVMCVCGFGMGSSLILKMSVESAMRELGVACDVEHWAAGTMEGIKCDLIVTAEDFRETFGGRDDVVFVQNIVKVPEIKEALKEYLEKKNLL